LIPSTGALAEPAIIRDLAQAAEALGYDSVWVIDHVVIPAAIDSPYPYNTTGEFATPPRTRYLEPLAVLGFLAGCTQHVRLGIRVLVLPLRNPVLAAKVVATLDVLSGGRVDFGIGVGWMREEFEALGYDYFERRGAVTDDQLRLMKAMWTQEIAAYDGEFFHLPPVGSLPHPVQRPHPPIWIGGDTPAAIRRAGRLGDGWLPLVARTGYVLEPEAMAAGLRRMRREAARAGRDPAGLSVLPTMAVTLHDGHDKGAVGAPRRPFTGRPDEVAADFVRYREAGAQRFVIGLGGGGGAAELLAALRRFAAEVMPLVPPLPPMPSTLGAPATPASGARDAS
jgi:probable F420-dependent oxidoreductase